MTANRSWLATAGVALALVVGAGAAQARSDVHWSIGVGVPGVVVGATTAPGYYAPPAPVYYTPPAPVYYAPPVYRAPAPVYYAPPPVYVAPRPYWRGDYHRHHHHGRRDWR